jgi:hypothetical protein
LKVSNIEMLTPECSAIALINQPVYQGVQSHDRLVPFNNCQLLAAGSASGEQAVSHRSVPYDAT